MAGHCGLGFPRLEGIQLSFASPGGTMECSDPMQGIQLVLPKIYSPSQKVQENKAVEEREKRLALELFVECFCSLDEG